MRECGLLKIVYAGFAEGFREEFTNVHAKFEEDFSRGERLGLRNGRRVILKKRSQRLTQRSQRIFLAEVAKFYAKVAE